MRRASEPREPREIGKGKRGRGNKYGALQSLREPYTAFEAREPSAQEREHWAPKRNSSGNRRFPNS